MRINRHTLRLLERLENSPLMKQTRLLERLENSPFMQQTRLLERLENSPLMKQTRLLERLENPPLMKQTRLLERLENSPLMQLNSAFLPIATRIASLNTELARAVEPYRDAIASVSAWEATLTARMTALKIPWALRDHLDQSMMGFARLSRLSDAVHTPRPYSRPVRELVASELGAGVVESDQDEDTPIGRDENAVKAGLNPELIAFPTAAYSGVVLAAGFKFHLIPTPVPQAAESPDPGAVFDPMHGAVLTGLEQRLRHIVEERLSGLAGPNWFKHRVSGKVRKNWLDRQEQERQAGRPVFPPIQYADFMDLADVISQSDNWREAFKSIFQNKEDFLVSLRRLHPIRKAIAHSRPLGKSDVLTLVNEATRIFNALEIQVWS